MSEVRLIANYSDSDESDSEENDAQPLALEESVEAFMKEINAIDPGLPATSQGNGPKKDRKSLDCDWKELVDASTGYPYYWNTKTNEITWNAPVEFTTFQELSPAPSAETSSTNPKAVKRPPDAEGIVTVPEKTRKTDSIPSSDVETSEASASKPESASQDLESSQDSVQSQDEDDDVILERLKQRSRLLKSLGGQIPEGVTSLFAQKHHSDNEDRPETPPKLPRRNVSTLPLLSGREERESFAFDLSSFPLTDSRGHRHPQRGLGYHVPDDETAKIDSKSEKFISFVRGDTLNFTQTDQPVVMEPLRPNSHDRSIESYIIRLSKSLHCVPLPELNFAQTTKIQLEVLLNFYRQGVLDGDHFSHWLAHVADRLSRIEKQPTVIPDSAIHNDEDTEGLIFYGPEPFKPEVAESVVETGNPVEEAQANPKESSPAAAHLPMDDELSSFYSDLATLGVFEPASSGASGEDQIEKDCDEKLNDIDSLARIAVPAASSEKLEEERVVAKKCKKTEKLKVGSSLKTKKKGEVDTLVAKWKKAREELLK